MSERPSLSGREVISTFSKVGFVVDRIAGSHHILKREGHPIVLSVPVHANKIIGKGLLRRLQAHYSVLWSHSGNLGAFGFAGLRVTAWGTSISSPWL